MKKEYNFQILLPLKHRVIFVDWHGVLSQTLFWHSILNNTGHRLHVRVRAATEIFFRGQPDRVRSWMRGETDAAVVISELKLNLPRKYAAPYLRRVLSRDCRRTSPDERLVTELKRLRSDTWLVMATDNMDCFADTIRQNQLVASSFDQILCSSEIGVLKSDGVDRFFGPWLSAHRLGFRDAILIDDSASTCSDFEDSGGLAILHKNVDTTIRLLSELR